jgi:hypothetical protein
MNCLNPFLLIEDVLGDEELQRRRDRRAAYPPTNPADWKAGLALQIEIFLFVVLVFGLEHTALLTLIFEHPRGGPPISPAEAQRLFKSAWRHLLPKFFLAYIAVMDFHRSGKIHFHLVVALRINIRGGWDFEIDEQHRALQQLIRNEKRRATPEELKQLRSLSRHLTINPEVKSLFSQLRRELKKLGFAADYPFELKPVRHPKRLARYLARRFLESKAARHLRPRGSRCRRFSRNYRRHVDIKCRFSPVGPGATLYRHKKAAVGRAFGIDDIGTMITRFGKSWEHAFGEILRPVSTWDSAGFFSWQREELNRRAAEWNEQRQNIVRDPRDTLRENMEREAMEWAARRRAASLQPSAPPPPSETLGRVPPALQCTPS